MLFHCLLAFLLVAIAAPTEAQKGRPEDGSNVCYEIAKKMHELKRTMDNCGVVYSPAAGTATGGDVGFRCVARRMEWINDDKQIDMDLFAASTNATVNDLLAEEVLTEEQVNGFFEAAYNCYDNIDPSNIHEMLSCFMAACAAPARNEQ